jgi:hypothetical protein
MTIKPTCSFCLGQQMEVADFLFEQPAPICSACLDHFGESLKDSDIGEFVEAATECTFCDFLREQNEFVNHLLSIASPARFPQKPLCITKKLINGSTTSICSECVAEYNSLLATDREEKSSFFANLGPECGPEKCLQPNCDRLRIKLAVYCLQHQFDGLWCKRNPSTDGQDK